MYGIVTETLALDGQMSLVTEKGLFRRKCCHGIHLFTSLLQFPAMGILILSLVHHDQVGNVSEHSGDVLKG
jgi:hypothetical protein